MNFTVLLARLAAQILLGIAVCLWGQESSSRESLTHRNSIQ